MTTKIIEKNGMLIYEIELSIILIEHLSCTVSIVLFGLGFILI